MRAKLLGVLALVLTSNAKPTPAQKRDIVPPDTLQLHISAQDAKPLSPTLYGYMYEDINWSGDGGLYAELLQNRAFQKVIPHSHSALYGWESRNGAWLSVTDRIPGVSEALPNSLKVDIPKNTKGKIGFQNTGYWGMKVQQGWKYTAHLYVRSDSFSGTVSLSLRSTAGEVFATASIEGGSVGQEWRKFNFEFNPEKSASHGQNVFVVEVEGEEAAGQTIYFGFFSLFPPTFRGRENGLRIDLAEALAGTRPSIFRFPGGNNLEGQTIEERWQWNLTIGPLETRPGRVGDWTYPNTDGLGLLEYLEWCEDLSMEPIMGVWAGLSIQNYSNLVGWPTVHEDELQPYIDQAIDQASLTINFVVGDASTNKWAALRAEYGHPEPFKLNFVEIGNEDWFGEESYYYRWRHFRTQLGEAFPDIKFIATSLMSQKLDSDYTYIDRHVYDTPRWFIENSVLYDNFTRNGTQIFEGEYAATSMNEDNPLGVIGDGRFEFPTLQASVAEAAYLTGVERNTDIVFASAYAPSLNHLRNTQWTPDMISYDATQMILSTSYYTQQLFSANRGTHVLQTSPVSSLEYSPLFWSVSHHETDKTLFIKIANTERTSITVRLFFDDFAVKPYYSSSYIANGQYNISNTPENPFAVTPNYETFAYPDTKSLNHSISGQSVTVLTFQIE